MQRLALISCLCQIQAMQLHNALVSHASDRSRGKGQQGRLIAVSMTVQTPDSSCTLL